MTIDSTVFDFSQTTADAALRLFRAHAPIAAVEAVAPFLVRLFSALEDGHSFIWLSEAEAASLATAQPIVGNSGDTPLILLGRRLFLGRMWQLEHDLAAEIVRLAQAPVAEINWMQAAQNLAEWFAEAGGAGQQRAAALALLQALMLISGGPGTGKTTTVAKLLGLLCDNNAVLPRIALAAPTGKAAAHMARALHQALETFRLPEHIKQHLLQQKGQTVHRLLQLRPPQMNSAFGHEQPLPLDILVVDEASMLDVSLLLKLLRAVANGCRVILLGDENQLPSVGAGAVLTALVQDTILNTQTAAELVNMLPQHGFTVADEAPALAQNVARLLVSHRFGDDSGIGCLARAVVSGSDEEAWAQFARFPVALKAEKSSVIEQIAALYKLQTAYWQAVDAGDVAAAFRLQSSVVVLAAWREDAVTFNAQYRRYIERKGRANPDVPWFAGQVLMITRNDYALNVFNGDIGLILRDSDNETALTAYFPTAEGFRKVALSRLPAHESAFAMTVHKSQGSEYQEVWLLPPSSSFEDADDSGSLNRALLYTALTRARDRFVFWGDEAGFRAACKNNQPRRSALRDMIGRRWQR